MSYYEDFGHSNLGALDNNMPLFNNEYGVTEPASSYYFHTDLNNDRFLVMPLFIKNAFHNAAVVLNYSFQLVLVFMAKLYALFTFVGVNTFEKFVDTTVYVVGYIVRSALTPMYSYLQNTFIFNLTLLDKIVIGSIAVYFLAKLLVSVFKSNNQKNEELLERIDALENQLSVLKKRDRQREEDVGTLFERQGAIRELETKLKNFNKRANELKKIM